MGWESFGEVRFNLWPLLQGQTRIVKPKSYKQVTRLFLVERFGMVNQPIGNHGLGIFWCDWI